MNSDQIFRDRVSEVIDEALSVPESERAEFLKSLCRDEPDVAAEVISLLQFESLAQQIDELPGLNPDWFNNSTLNPPLQTRVEVDGFRIIREIGQGANSVVYEAEQLDPCRQVAIKVLSLASGAADAADRFKLEGHIGARLEHPLIARVYQTGVTHSGVLQRPYIAMEYVRGAPLTSVIHDPKLGFEVRRSILRSIFQAIQFAHEQGVIHRDIKPSNVIVDLDSESSNLISVKVVDFGIAKLIDDTSIPVSIRTLDAQLLGTLRYMSPERISGQCNGGTVASDVYSLGVLADELLSGSCRNVGSAGSNTIRHNKLSEHVQHVLQRMAADEPKDRYATMLEALNAMDAAFDDTRLITHLRSYHRRLNALSNRVYLNHRRMVMMFVLCTTLIACGTGWLALRYMNHLLLTPSGTTRTERADADVWEFVKAQLEIANAFSESGEFEKAAQVHQNMLDEIGGLDQYEVRLQHSILLNMAYVAMKSGKRDEALQMYRALRDESNLIANMGRKYAWRRWFSTAHGLQSCGDFESAREMYLFAIGLPEFEQQDWRIRSRGLAFYGGFLWMQGDLDNAERMLYQSIQEPSDQLTLEDRIDLALRHSSYGLILDTMGRHEEATPYHLIARESLTNLYGPMHVSVHRAALNEASNALYAKKLDRAFSLSSQAKMFFQTSPRAWTSELLECETLLAAIALLTGQVQQSLEHLDSLIAIGSEHSEPTYRWNDYATPLLAAALLESGDRSARLDEIYTDCVQSINNLGSAHPWLALLMPYFEQAENEWVALWTGG